MDAVVNVPKTSYRSLTGGNIMNSIKSLIIPLVSLVLLLTGSGPAVSGENYSGFLGDYPKFQKDKEYQGAMTYYAPGFELKKYTKIMLDPIEIWYAPDSKYKGITPDDLKILVDAFRAAIIYEFEPDYPVVSRPGSDVLRLRLAITNVYAKKKKRGLLGYTPAGLVITTGIALAGKNISLEDATIEGEMLHSQTHERLGALYDRRSASAKKKGEKTSWEKIEETVRFYAKLLRASFDKEHGR
jgi:hypothetical protein